MTVHEVAAYLQLDRATIYRLVAEGQLPSFRVGRQRRFDRSAVLAAMKKLNLRDHRPRKPKWPYSLR